jgi:hypothetical protein
LQTMKVKNWKKSVLNRDLWKTVVERTETHIELWRLSRRSINLSVFITEAECLLSGTDWVFKSGIISSLRG